MLDGLSGEKGSKVLSAGDAWDFTADNSILARATVFPAFFLASALEWRRSSFNSLIDPSKGLIYGGSSRLCRATACALGLLSVITSQMRRTPVPLAEGGAPWKL